MSFLIRVQLPDAPGTLGAVATALGAIGADILSVDVVERVGGTAIDDLVVELPSGLRYEIVKPGEGPFPKATDTVKVHYTGWTSDGKPVLASGFWRDERAGHAS